MSESTRGSWPWMIEADTVLQLLERRAALTPDALALLDEEGRRVTCRQLLGMVEQYAALLAELGIESGTRVAWQLPTRISTYAVMLALRRLGAVQAPIIPLYREREVTACLAAVEAEHFLVPGTWKGHDFVAMAERLDLPERVCPRVIVIDLDPTGADHEVATVTTPAADPDDVRWIYFTSGSSGMPKGVRHTDDSLLTGGLGFAGRGRLGAEPDELAAAAFPIAHVGGVLYLIAALGGGYPILLQEAFVPGPAAEAMHMHGVTVTGGAPPFYQALVALAQDAGVQPFLPSLRVLKGGGAPCSVELFEQVRDVLGTVVAHDYGMTEVPMIAAGDPHDPGDLLARTDGGVVPGNEVRAVGPSGEPLPSGESGELQVSGRGVCRGYLDHSETERAFTADGWFRTGDLGIVHDSGHVEVVGRLKDVIIRKGENLVPFEIELVLGTFPGVAEVAVVGLPDEERGELVCAVVAVRPGHPRPSLVDLAEHLAAAGLMRQKWPERLEVVDELPRTGLAKVAKAELKRRFGAPETPPATVGATERNHA